MKVQKWISLDWNQYVHIAAFLRQTLRETHFFFSFFYFPEALYSWGTSLLTLSRSATYNLIFLKMPPAILVLLSPFPQLRALWIPQSPQNKHRRERPAGQHPLICLHPLPQCERAILSYRENQDPGSSACIPSHSVKGQYSVTVRVKTLVPLAVMFSLPREFSLFKMPGSRSTGCQKETILKW